MSSSRPDTCSVNVVELRRRLGQRHEVDIEITLVEQVVVGSRTLPTPVIGSLVIESIERGISATGAVHFHWEGDCRRCLDVVSGRIEAGIAEIFQINAPEDSEIIDFDGESVDLLPIVRDAVMLSLPLAPLCDVACAGPDPDRYPAVTDEQRAADDNEPGPDARWAALDELDLN